jgi:hypothetical protein
LGPASRALLLGAAAASLALLCMAAEPRMAVTWEFAEYGDIAREIARGRGYRSHVTLPSLLAWADAARLEAQGGTWPVMARHPGFALALSPFLLLLGSGDAAVGLALATFFGLWAAASYLLLRGPLGEGTAVATALLLLANPVFARFFVPGGYADVLFAAAVLAFLRRGADLLAPPPASAPPRLRHWAALGLLGSLCWSLRFNFTLFLGILALLAIRRNPRGVLACLAAFAVPLLAFSTWQRATFGTGASPPTWWNLLDGLVSGAPWLQYRTWGPGDLLEADRLSRLLFRKWPNGLEISVRQLPDLFHYLWLMPCFFASLLMPQPDTRRRALLALSTLCFASSLVVLAAFRYEIWFFQEPLGLRLLAGRYFVWMAPLAVAFGIDAARRLLAGRPRAVQAGAAAVLLALQAAAWTPYWQPSSRLYPDVEFGFDELPAVQALRRAEDHGLVSRARPLVTNVPAAAGWYLDRPALGLPQDPGELDRLSVRHPPAAVLFLGWSVGEPHNQRRWVELARDPARLASFAAERGLAVAWYDDRSWLLIPAGPAGSPPGVVAP